MTFRLSVTRGSHSLNEGHVCAFIQPTLMRSSIFYLRWKASHHDLLKRAMLIFWKKNTLLRSFVPVWRLAGRTRSLSTMRGRFWNHAIMVRVHPLLLNVTWEFCCYGISRVLESTSNQVVLTKLSFTQLDFYCLWARCLASLLTLLLLARSCFQ